MLRNIEIEEARDILIDKTKALSRETVSLEDSLNRILASQIDSEINVPHFNKSALDGYCLNSKDTEDSKEKSKSFTVIGKIGAGEVFKGSYKKDSAVRIMTGAPIPEGFDCIVKQEEVEADEKSMRIFRVLKPRENIVKIGEDIKSGSSIMNPGVRLSPEAMGILASLGKKEVKVYKRPKIGVVSTGKELLDICQSLEHGRIYNSNYYALSGMIRELGGEVIKLGIADDSVEEISEKIEKNIGLLDMVITTGGASVGEYDLIHEVYEKLEAETLFWRVKMKPGTPILSALYQDKLLIGLSGNPSAALISFEKIVSPAIKKMTGRKSYMEKRVKAVLKEDFPKRSPQRRLLRAKFQIENQVNSVYIGKKQKPGSLRPIYECNCLIDIESGNKGLKAGDTVEVILLKGDSFL